MKILIFTSNHGGSWVTAKCIKKSLEAKCDVVIQALDHKWPANSIGSFKIFKWLVVHGYYLIVKYAIRIGSILLFKKNRILENYLKECIEREKPNLIISNIPYINAMVLRINFEKKPFIVVMPDLDSHSYCYGWFTPEHHYKFFIPYKIPELCKVIESIIPQNNINAIGYPIREEFFKTYDNHDQLRKELNLPKNREIIPVMMGSIGAMTLTTYAKQLIDCSGKIDHPCHFVFLCGRNEKIRRRLNRLFESFYDDKISFSTVGWSDRVHHFFAIAKCVILKPGSSSLNEAIYMKIPILIDSQALEWEKLNLDVVINYNFGHVVNNFAHLPEQINLIIENNATYRKSITSFLQSHQINFNEKFYEEVQKLATT